MTVILTTDRLTLRTLTADDVDALVDLDADPEVMRFITGGRPTPREEIERALPGWISDPAGYGRLAALRDGEFVGWFGLRSPKPSDAVALRPGDVELGYRLCRAVWGQGLATEGSVALIRKGFAELRLRRIIATTMTVNRASRRVMEKAGLRYLSTFHLHWDEVIEGTAEGDVLYGLTRSEWAAGAS